MLHHIPKVIVVVAAALAFVGSAPIAAHDVAVSQAWSRASPKGAKVAAGYLAIENRGAAADRLLSASSAASAKVEIHRMSMQDGIMTMRPVEGGLPIPPDQTVILAPGGDHVMFVGLNAPFEEGQRIPVVLRFERAGRVDVDFEVGPVGAKGPRLQIASNAPHVADAPPPKPAPVDEPFFTHICGTRIMADVTVTPGRQGPVEITVKLEDGDEKPLSVDALSVTLSNPDKNVAPVAAVAERLTSDTWKVRMTAVTDGKWSLALGIDMAPGDRIDVAAPILIE
jgi:copper(I)-binding protein